MGNYGAYAWFRILGKIYPEINYNNNLKSLLEKSFNNINEFKNNLNSYENIDKILESFSYLF